MNKENIVKKNLDFQRIIKNNKPYKYKDYVLYVEKNNDNNYHFGFSVGKKIGKAVIRNKIKRQLKSIVSKKDYQNVRLGNLFKNSIITTRKTGGLLCA